MATVVVFLPDLLFRSTVASQVAAAGHEPVLVSEPDALRRELTRAKAVIVDLTFDAADQIEQLRLARPPGVKTLAFYSHVETDVRERAERAGYDVIVPRSRMAREGAQLIERLLRSGA